MSSILIVAYRRYLNLSKILDACSSAGHQRIFVAVDGPANPEARIDVAMTLQTLEKFKKFKNLKIKVCAQSVNVGCAVSMINACDQVFKETNELIILEDDCIPTKNFWKYAEQALQSMQKNSSIGIFCGAQFAPIKITQNEWALSNYPFHWGWGITYEKWHQIRQNLLSDISLKARFHADLISIAEAHYWNAGSNRALRGETDVWDTLFVRELLKLNLKVLLPPQNLISNVGNDSYALHSRFNSFWTDSKTGEFLSQPKDPEFNFLLNHWTRSQYFNISNRHIFTTRISKLMRFNQKPKFNDPLAKRLGYPNPNFF